VKKGKPPGFPFFLAKLFANFFQLILFRELFLGVLVVMLTVLALVGAAAVMPVMAVV
jgi:hypothetical protein